jgi:hypothetical protein
MEGTRMIEEVARAALLLMLAVFILWLVSGGPIIWLVTHLILNGRM